MTELRAWRYYPILQVGASSYWTCVLLCRPASYLKPKGSHCEVAPGRFVQLPVSELRLLGSVGSSLPEQLPARA